MDEHDLVKNLPDNPQPLFFRRTDARKLFGISPRQLENLAMERSYVTSMTVVRPGRVWWLMTALTVQWMPVTTPLKGLFIRRQIPNATI